MERLSHDEPSWETVRQRVARLEEANGRLRSRSWLALRLNVAIIVGIVCWLAWPGKSLTAESVTAAQVGADRFWSGESSLGRDWIRVTGRRDQSWMELGYRDDRDPRLYINNQWHGHIEANLYVSPFLGLYALGLSERADRQGPQIELSFCPDRSPHIMLRDSSGVVLWEAPPKPRCRNRFE
jgi:hypothetical protein